MNIDQSSIILVDPLELSIHPSAREVPELTEDEPEFVALFEDIKSTGILHAIDIDSRKRVLDGRHRVKIALRLKMPTVPAIVRPDVDAVSIIVKSLLLRRHYTKSALAFCAYPALRDAYEEARGRQGIHGVDNPFTVEIMAERFGISSRFYHYAAKLHDIFSNNPDYKDLVIKDILSGEMGLGAAIAGFHGRKATKGQAKTRENPVKLFKQAWQDLKNRYRFWDKFSEDDRTTVTSAITETLHEMPPSLLSVVERRLKAELKARHEER